jgi:hypothetical protein
MKHTLFGKGALTALLVTILVGALIGCSDLIQDEPILENIAVTSPPTKTTYTIGQALDLSGLVVTGTYSDDTTKTETVRLVDISGYDANKTGLQTLTVTVNGKTATFVVTVSDSGGEPVDDIADYLANAQGGATADNPVSLPVNGSLADGRWESILSAINGAGKYVMLDLSACAMTGTEFDPGTAEGADKVTALVLPATAKSIKAGTYDNPTFSAFTALGSINGTDIETVGTFAFRDCGNLTILGLPVTTTIGDYAFAGCWRLTTLSLPMATTIGSGAFRGCENLESVSLPATPPIIGDIFYDTGASGLITVSVPMGAVSAYTSAWGVSASTSAGGNTSVYGNNHKAVTITDGTAEPDIDIADYLANAQGGATADNPVSLSVNGSLTDGRWEAILSTISESGKYVALDLSACAMTGTEFDPGTAEGADKVTALVLPVTAKSIKAGDGGNAAFRAFTALGSISGAGVETVGREAFYYCAALKSVSLPVATDIGGTAFAYCENLESVSLPAATDIGYDAFSGTALTSVSLPSSLTALGGNPFSSCSSLVSITVDPANTVFSARDGMLMNKAETTLIAYPSATGDITLPSFTTIGDGAFSGTSITTGSLPAATSIGLGAFFDCKSLASVSLPVAMDIGGAAFAYCENLESVSLPAAIDIGNATFLDCENLESVSLPVATSIGNIAFEDCTSLTSVSLPAATSIGGSAFDNCTALMDVSLPIATDIDYQAFLYCASLTSVSLPLATSIGNSAFNGCIALTEVSLPAATSIGVYAFSGCAVLESVSLPVATDIGGAPFAYCENLESVSLPATPPSIGTGYNGIFNYTGSTGTITISVPIGAVSVYTSTWGVSASTPANGNTSVYGEGHKAVFITGVANGGAIVSVNFDKPINGVSENFVLSKSGTPATITLEAPDTYTAYAWYLNDADAPVSVTAAYTLNAADCRVGRNFITVWATTSAGAHYSKEITFIVNK